MIKLCNFQDTFETHKRSFTSAFSICMTVPLNIKNDNFNNITISPLDLWYKVLNTCLVAT